MREWTWDSHSSADSLYKTICLACCCSSNFPMLPNSAIVPIRIQIKALLSLWVLIWPGWKEKTKTSLSHEVLCISSTKQKSPWWEMNRTLPHLKLSSVRQIRRQFACNYRLRKKTLWTRRRTHKLKKKLSWVEMRWKQHLTESQRNEVSSRHIKSEWFLEAELSLNASPSPLI